MHFLPEPLEDYINQHTQEPATYLQELERETYLKILNPRMLAGHYQGRVLSMLSHMIKPKYVLEIGTYTGYSALCWAEGLAPDGHIYTLEKNEELESIIQRYVKASPYANQITLKIGSALDIIPTISKRFDLVYLDADKENYLNYYNLVFKQVNIGGYIIADNVLWSGKVLDPLELKQDPDTHALHQYNTLIHQDPRVEHVLLGIRDGLLIARKISD